MKKNLDNQKYIRRYWWKRPIIFTVIFLIQNSCVWAATSLSSIVDIPETVATQSFPELPVQPMEKLSLPTEIPIQMMEFPPLQSMHFDMVPTVNMIPVSDFDDSQLK